MAWKVGDPTPYDGWYNGNALVMIKNGTYADFRPKLKLWVDYGIMEASKLVQFDAMWEAIPIEERMRLRERVVKDSTPVPTEIETDTGRRIKAIRAKPSENNSYSPDIIEKRKTRRILPPKRGRAPGALTNENNPLVRRGRPPKSPEGGEVKEPDTSPSE